MKFIFFLITVVSGFTIPNTRIVVLPGYGCCKDDYQDIVNSCAVHNVDVDIVPIERHDWIQPIKSVFKKKFWDYKLKPGLSGIDAESSFDILFIEQIPTVCILIFFSIKGFNTNL